MSADADAVHGGKRRGAGRPKGTKGIKHKPATSKAVALTREAVREEIRERGLERAPTLKAIEVMRDNMMWCHQLGQTFLDKAEEAYKQGDIPVAIDFLGEKLRMLTISQKCAEGVVGYEEAKLTATVPAPEAEPEPEIKDVTPGVAAPRDHLKHLSARYAPYAPTIDHDKDEPQRRKA